VPLGIISLFTAFAFITSQNNKEIQVPESDPWYNVKTVVIGCIVFFAMPLSTCLYLSSKLGEVASNGTRGVAFVTDIQAQLKVLADRSEALEKMNAGVLIAPKGCVFLEQRRNPKGVESPYLAQFYCSRGLPDDRSLEPIVPLEEARGPAAPMTPNAAPVPAPLPKRPPS